MKQRTQSFNDGVFTVYKVGNIALPGTTPKQGLTKKVGPLHYEERVVGMGRFFVGKQSQIEISQILRVPRINAVSTQDVAIPIDGKQYEIVQIQYPPEVEPPCMDLSLRKVVAAYAVG